MSQEDKVREWLSHWHSVLDAETGKDAGFDFEEALDEPDGDFRMHFTTWELSDDALRRCFEVLPAGEEMANRAIEMRKLHQNDRAKPSEDEALQLFQNGLKAYAALSDDADLSKPIRVKHVTSDGLNQATTSTDRVAIVLEDFDWKLPAENQEAASFLQETLYQLGQSYDIVDYVTWPLFPAREGPDLYQPFARLAVTDTYFPLLDDEGPVLFVVTDRDG